jgi:hypothetical protein
LLQGLGEQLRTNSGRITSDEANDREGGIFHWENGRENIFTGIRRMKRIQKERTFSLFKFLPLSPLITFIPVRFFFSLSQGVNLCPT